MKGDVSMKKVLSLILSIIITLNITFTAAAFDIFYHAAVSPVINSVSASQDGKTFTVSFTSSLTDAETVRSATFDAIKELLGSEEKLMSSQYAYLACETVNYCQISLDGENFISVKSTKENEGTFEIDLHSDILIPLKNSGEDILSLADGFTFYLRVLTASENHTESPETVFVFSQGEKTQGTGSPFGYIEYVLPEGTENPEGNTVFFEPPLKEDLKLVSPARTGYLFYGWENENGKSINKIPAGTVCARVISRWLPMTYEINYFLTTHHDPSFNYSFGRADNSKNPTEYTVGTSVVITDIASPVAGFTFAGWYYEEDFSGERVTQIKETDTGVKLLYAKWISEKETEKDREELRQEFIKNGHYGDIDDDGVVSAYDARLILRYVVGLEDIAPEHIKRADYTGSGKVSSADARTTLRISVGIDDIYTVLLQNGVLP